MTSPSDVCVICMKWGDQYSSEYVNVLYNAVSEYLPVPFDFLCLTDDPSGISDAVKCIDFSFDQVPADEWTDGK